MRTLLLFLGVAAASYAAVNIERVGYKGWPNCYRISNGEVELIVTADIGPRIMRYAFIGGQNVFKEFAETLGKAGGKQWQMIGGHRLWHAPEAMPRTYAPDNGPVDVRIEGTTLHAIEPLEPSTSIQKEMIIRLADHGTEATILHRLTNKNVWNVELAAWALTMMAQGGVAIVPFPPRGSHDAVLGPTNPLTMWAYTDFSDPRWHFGKKYLTLRQDPNAAEPQKAGIFNPNTWEAYLLGSELFIKRAKADPSKTYPDFGCSLETYTSAEFLEMETLGPLTRIEPNGSVEHTERWTLHRNVQLANWSDAEIDRVVLPLAEQ
jgi:hypothetical protein